MQDYFRQLSVFVPLKLYFNFWSKFQHQEQQKWKLHFFHSLGNSKSYMIDFFVLKNIFHNLPYKLIPKSINWLRHFWRCRRKTAEGHSIIGVTYIDFTWLWSLEQLLYHYLSYCQPYPGQTACTSFLVICSCGLFDNILQNLNIWAWWKHSHWIPWIDIQWIPFGIFNM